MSRVRSAWRLIIERVCSPIVIAALLVLGVSGEARAQLKGHYIPGFTGMENASQPPPSITLALPVYLYPADTIKDDNGDTIGGHPHITAAFTGLSVIVVTNAKVFPSSARATGRRDSP